MATSANLGLYLIGLILTLTVSTGFIALYDSVASNYLTSTTSDRVVNSAALLEAQNLSEELANNIRETGIEDESSDTKIISVGWNSMKLFTETPSITESFIDTGSKVLNLNVLGIDVKTLVVFLMGVWIAWSLIFYLFFGRA